MSNQQQQGSEQWASRIGVILAVAGSAVGLGNFLRFPGQAAQNGGGAFMLPYFVSLLVLGIPLCWAEWTMGRYAGLRGFHSAPGIYAVLCRRPGARYFGALALVIPLVIYMYYVLMESWCLGYAISYLTGDLMPGSEAIGKGDAAAYGKFFGDFVGKETDGALFGAGHRIQLLVLAGTFAFNFVLIYRGVTKGIETFCKVAMPLMVVLALIVLVRVLTLGTPDPTKPEQSVLGGLNFMWDPDFGALASGKTWLAASGQIFFSLSVGFGIIVNYASYLKKEDDVVLSGLTSSSMNEFFEVCLGGLITLPAAFIFLGTAAGEQGTFDLGFVSLPNVFAQMPGGRLFGFLWFAMLFIAAITSSVSMLQPVIAFLEEGFGLKRHASAALLGLISALGCGFVLTFSEGLTALDTFDFWAGTVLIFLLALVQSVIYGWVFGIAAGDREASRGANLRIPKFVQIMLKYIVPVYLLVIFATFCAGDLPSRDEPAFQLTQGVVAALHDGEVTEALAREFPGQTSDALQRATLRRRGDDAWEIRNAQQVLLYRIAADAEGDIQVLEHKPGRIEMIGNNRAALSSVLFLACVFAFLLLLVHIAGVRWQKEGRFQFEKGETA